MWIERERELETGSLGGKVDPLHVWVAGVPGAEVEVERAAALHQRTASPCALRYWAALHVRAEVERAAA